MDADAATRETKRGLRVWLESIKGMIKDVSPVDDCFFGHVCKWFDDLATHWARLCGECGGCAATLCIIQYREDYQTIVVDAGGRKRDLVLHKIAVWPAAVDAAVQWFSSRV